MGSYFIFKGTDSRNVTGLIVSTLPPITKPAKRYSRAEIDGRDGDIITEEGYEAYDKEIEIGLAGNFDINAIINWLDGSGDLILSNESDKLYKAEILKEIDFEKLLRFKTAKIKFHVQPFKYKYNETSTTYNAINEASGDTNINLTDAGNSKLRQANIDGKCEQDTTTGKNIYNANSTTRTISGIATPVISANGDTITLTHDSNSNTAILRIPVSLEENTNYIISGSAIFSDITGNGDSIVYVRSGSSAVSGSIKLDTSITTEQSFSKTFNSGSYTSAELWLYLDSTAETCTRACTYKNIMLRKSGTTAGEPTDYVPYDNIALKITGKNLLDLYSNNITNTGITSTGQSDGGIKCLGTTTGTYYIITSDITQEFPAGQYMFSIKSALTHPVSLRFYYEDGTYTNYQINTGSLSRNITTTQKAIKYRIYCGTITTGTVLNETIYFQLEKGSSATDYEAYQSNTTLIDLQGNELCKIGDVKDELVIKETGEVSITKRIGKVVLDGTESSWNTYSTNTGLAYRVDITNIKLITATTIIANLLCTYYTKTSQEIIYDEEVDYGVAERANQSQIMFRNKDITTLADFKTWLASNPVTVYYVLATPTEVSLASVTAPTIYEGVNHISLSGETDFSVIYYKPKSLVVANSGLQKSKPKITLTGSGAIAVSLGGAAIFTYTFPSGDSSVVIDSEKEDAYLENTLKNRNMQGEFPILEPGNNTISWTGSLTNILVEPKSRWL